MALKKPSDLFNKRETSVVFQSSEISSNITETYDRFRDNLDKVNVLSEQIEYLSQQLSEKMTRTDLENAMLSNLMVLDENFKSIRNQVKGLNKEDLKEFKVNVSNLTEIVENLVETELPKYKKQVTKSEFRIGDKFEELKEVVEENIIGIRDEIDNKVNNIAEAIDNNLEYFSNQLQETSSEVKTTVDTYNKLSKIVENRISKENDKLEEYSQVIQSLHEAFVELEESLQKETSTYNQIIEEKFATISSGVKNTIDNIDEDVDTFKNQVSSDISSIKADVVIFEKHNKDTEKTIQEFSEQLYKISEIDESIGELNEDIGKLQNQYDSISNQSIETKKDLEVVERYIQNHHQELVELKEEVFGEIEKLPVGNLQENLERLEKKIDYIKETYSKIEPEVIVKEVIKEGLLNEPPDTKNSDPLTPLDQKFVTLDQLQNHYRLFINRIQQQLSTLGGGGETRLKYLDDIVGIATNASAYDGKYLKYNHSLGKFEFTDVDISNDSWADGVSGPYTLGSVGIGTTNPQTSLDVRGAITIGIGTVGINSISSTTDIQSWYYTNKSKSVTGDDSAPAAVYVGAAGTAMFMVGDTGNDVNQYTLSTPYDVSTAGASIAAFSVATRETTPTGIDFNPTGTKMFLSGQTGVAPLIASGEYVHEYSLSTAWTVSSAGYTTSFNVTEDTAPGGVTFGNSGYKMYVVGSTYDTVYQYSLSTPYSLASGVTYDNISLILGTNPLVLETLPTDISFNSTGTVLWIVGNTQDRIYEFRLGTAWDISTAVFYDDVYIGFNEITVTGLHVIPEQNVAYIVGSNSDTVFQYSTNTPAIEIASSGISSVSSIVLNNETRVKDKLYVKGIAHFDSSIVAQANIQVDGTLTASSTVTFSATTTDISLGNSQTTGVLTLGGTSQTGSITLGRATTSQTLGIATGVSGVGTTKTINFGTGGASGSFTQINIGPTAGVGTVVINSGTNLLVGTTTATGTASQRLQVTGGAHVSTQLGVGVTNPASNTQVAIAGTLGISEVGGSGARTLLSSSGNGFTLNHNDNSNINFNSQGTNKLAYRVSDNTWSIPSGVGLLVGTGATTGTASQPLQVSGGAYVSGNLGIGNTNPQNTLDVGVGTIRLINKSSTGRFSQIYQDNNLIFSNSSTNDDFDWTNSTGSRMRLYGAGNLVIPGTFTPTGTASQRLQVDGGAYVSGSVGIGTTNPGATLNVVPTASSIAGLFSGTTSSDMVRITQLGTGNALVVEDETNPDATSFVVANDGKVGIGITNPGYKLVISGGLVGTSQVRFVNSGSGDLYINHSNLVSSLQAAANIQLALGSNNVEVIRINNSGSVGIGTTNPTSPLHVVGSTLITGITTVGLGTTSTPPSNSQMSFELTSDTNLRIKVRGTDGVLRSANITLA